MCVKTRNCWADHIGFNVHNQYVMCRLGFDLSSNFTNYGTWLILCSFSCVRCHVVVWHTWGAPYPLQVMCFFDFQSIMVLETIVCWKHITKAKEPVTMVHFFIFYFLFFSLPSPTLHPHVALPHSIIWTTCNGIIQVMLYIISPKFVLHTFLVFSHDSWWGKWTRHPPIHVVLMLQILFIGLGNVTTQLAI